MSIIIINIKGTQVQDGYQENTEFTTEGSISLKNGNGVISYSGVNDPHFTELTEIIVEGNMVIMKKSGSEEVEFVFEEGKSYTADYTTPFGLLHVTVLPTLVNVKMDKTSGRIELEYVLDIAGTQVVNRLKLSYVSDKLGNAWF